jgi:UDP-glucose 4-epimerase
MKQHHVITGVAGFIGRQLADSLLADGQWVTGVDDFSNGKPEHLADANTNPSFHMQEADVLDLELILSRLRELESERGLPNMIWHMAANSDISAGVANPSIDFKRTLQSTYSVIEIARSLGTKRISFASTSAVYGEREDVLTEDSGPLLPISNYGANKLASEALLSAAAESFIDTLWIFRFPNVVGPRSTHGAIHDFVCRLVENSKSLRVLGDGSQKKPYLHVSELIEAMKFIVQKANKRRNVYNIGGVDEGTDVAFMAKQVIERVAPGTPIQYTGGDRGWVGDVPRFKYSTERLRQLGWQPSMSSDAAVVRAINEIAASAGV